MTPHQWQQSEMLHLGRPTQAFNCSTNNLAESTGYLLLVRQMGELAVRKRGPADAIRGLCEVHCKQSAKKRKLVPSIWTTKHTDKAVQQHVIEREEALHFTVSTNGVQSAAQQQVS